MRTEQEEKTEQPIVDRWGRPAGMENLYLGAHVFLILGGPSINALDLSLLNQRGVVTFGVNNVSAHVRTQLWTFGDKPDKFHDAIWKDPSICKLVPYPKFQPRNRREIRSKTSPKEFQTTGRYPIEYPNCWGVRRNSIFSLETWLWEDTVNWGNGKRGVDKNGLPKVLNTMFQAVRLCYYLGFRTVYLLGADFSMSADRKYAFEERRTAGAIRSNNAAYEKMGWYFRQLRPWFDSANFTVLNCNAGSSLRAFDHLPYEEAVRATLAAERIPETIDTYGWYTGVGHEEMEEDE